MLKKRAAIAVEGISVLAIMFGAPAIAQTQAASNATPETDEIVVTATKRAEAQTVQKTPIAITAFGERQLEDLHVHTLSDLTAVVPNANFNSNSSNPGLNNFAIRGMAIYSSIPSSTPTVGVFVDGVYVGANAGAALSSGFDIAGIEVLRGPQGLLFGRNVTGGAILVRTGEPNDQFKVNALVGVETGLNKTFSTVISGPLGDDGVWSGKVGVYYNDDDGYFKNATTGNKHFGQRQTSIFHGALAFRPNSTVTNILRAEVGRSNGDGAALQSQPATATLPTPGKRDFTLHLNQEGYNNAAFENVTLESRVNTDFANGQLVNVLGWRTVDSDSLLDADGTSAPLLDFGIFTTQEQWSDELRFAGKLGAVDFTVGGFYYKDKLRYVETRQLAAARLEGGGTQNSTTWAVFSNFDIRMPADLVLTLGARYSEEDKDARTAPLSTARNCAEISYSCPSYVYKDSDSWSAFTPKVGLAWTPNSDTNLYAFWTRGFRSGGYNLRHLNAAAPLRPYDQEVADDYEIGLKQVMFNGRLRFALAAFRTKYRDLQRELIVSDPILGNVQTTVNTADATIQGLEFETSIRATDQFTLQGNFGYMDDRYNKIRRSLNGSVTVPASQYNLHIPYVAPWSYGATLNFRSDVNLGELSARIAYQHIDKAYSNDLNQFQMPATDNVDANVSLGLGSSGLRVTLYGKNILDKKTFGQNNPIFAGSFTTVNKGRIFGVELRYQR